jgi:hypothetical protein
MKNLHPRTKLAAHLATACLALAPVALAVDPPPDGGYPNFNTAEGEDALFKLTTGADNTAIGFHALRNNTEGFSNTATGSNGLFRNTTGTFNTATGFDALFNNATGSTNVATGAFALFNNTDGGSNTAVGWSALFSSRTANLNVAIGEQALLSNTSGESNTAIGTNALENNRTGSNNIALGINAGIGVEKGHDNIEIGNVGVFGDSKKIRIGTPGTQNATFIAGIAAATVASGVGVIIGIDGQLGTRASSARFKDVIKPMDKASEAILALQPVTFRYRKELDPDGIPQFGLVAEQVEKVNPDLVVRDEQGKAYTVRYEAVNAMLLNEFLKEHRKVEALEDTVAAQQKGFESQIAALTATLKAQAALIQRVSDQLGAQAPAPQVLASN